MKQVITIAVLFTLVFSCSNFSSKDTTEHSIKAENPCEGYSPDLFTISLDDKFSMNIVGGYHDMVKFYYQTTEIGFDPIKDGNCLNFMNQVPSRINDRLHLNHIQFGTTRERGEFYCYAIVDQTVYRSPVWIETVQGNEAVINLLWDGLTGNVWHGIMNSKVIVATFTFDPSAKNWLCTSKPEYGLLKGQTVVLKPEN